MLCKPAAPAAPWRASFVRGQPSGCSRCCSHPVGTEQKGKLDPKQRNLELERRVKIGPESKNAKTGREVSVTMQKRKQINKPTNVV